MASFTEPPAKRRRLSTQESTNTDIDIVIDAPTPAPARSLPHATGTTDEEQLRKEKRVGITEYINPSAPGFTGILKQRYTDFLVNEILPDGRVLHLENLYPPKRKQQESEEQDTQQKLDDARDGDSASGAQNVAKDVKSEGPAVDGQQDDHLDVPQLSEQDSSTLHSTFGAEVVKGVLSLYAAVLKNPKRKPKDFRLVTSEPIPDKETRTQAHQAIRRIFASKLETKTNEESNTISFGAAPAAKQQRGGDRGGAPRIRNKLGWDELGGEYLHFTLYKENKDTMEAVYFIASQMKMNVKSFQFGGTKDRRGVTVQRISAFRVQAEQLARIGRNLRGSRVGDYIYQPDGLELGDLGGNEFVITLRDCHFPHEEGKDAYARLDLARTVVREAVQSFRNGGYINYYGLQRFGSFSSSTDNIGLKLLQGNLKDAIDDILAFNPALLQIIEAKEKDCNASADGPTTPAVHGQNISTDDLARASAINIWNTTQNAAAACAKLPRKFSAETSIIRHLGHRDRRQDYQGALQTIPRNLRLMYVHAYQSLVWNIVAGERWRRFGNTVVEGDLVLEAEYSRRKISTATDEGSNPATSAAAAQVDEAGEVIVPAVASSTTSTRDTNTTDEIYARATALTSADVDSKLFQISDIVLPLPGYDVIYPSNSLGEFYKEFMASERGGCLDPYDMRRSWKDISLSGGYRKLVCIPLAIDGDVRLYQREDEQMVETDLERLNRRSKDEKRAGGNPADSVVREVKVEKSVTEVAQRETTSDGVRSADQGIEQDQKRPAGFGEPPSRVAVILKMKLGPSQYATMALRELMKADGVKTYKPDFGSGR